LSYAQRVAEGANRLTDEIGFSMGLSGLSLPTYAFFTPRGLFATYLVVSSLLRLLVAAAQEIPGDPLLTLADAAFARRGAAMAIARRNEERQRREGDEVPDVVLPGAECGLEALSDADWVVIASRKKPGWDKGATVRTPRKLFRLGTPVDRDRPEGLRAFYPLYALGQAEVVRRLVDYDNDALGAAPAPEPPSGSEPMAVAQDQAEGDRAAGDPGLASLGPAGHERERHRQGR
jgi:hypothetical protein